MHALRRSHAFHVLLRDNRICTCSAARCVGTSRTDPRVDDKGFILDQRQGQRESIENYASRGKDFRIELADSKDLGIVTRFVSEQFVRKVSMNTSINMTYDEFYALIEPDVANALPYKLTPVVFHEHRLVGVYTVRYLDEKSLAAKMPFDDRVRRSRQGAFKIKTDYAEDIRNGPYGWKANTHFVFLNEFYRQVGNLLPLDCRRLTLGEAVAVHPDYNGHDLMDKLCALTERLSVEKYGADYFGSISVSAAGNHVSFKRRFLVAEFPFDQFKADGKIVFDNRADKVESAVFRLAKLDNFLNSPPH